MTTAAEGSHPRINFQVGIIATLRSLLVERLESEAGISNLSPVRCRKEIRVGDETARFPKTSISALRFQPSEPTV